MSDGITDCYRDSLRTQIYGEWTCAIIDFLKNPTDENREIVREKADECDSVPRGLWSGPTALAKSVDDWMDKLLCNNEQTWLRFLYRNVDARSYSQLKKLSPFKDKLLIGRWYGHGFARMEGEEQFWCDEVIEEKDMCTYDGDKYLIIVDKPKINRIEWMGHFSEDSPYKKDRSK